MKKHFYITSPIYYATEGPHIGHTYTTLLCDILARRHRAAREEVFFLTGTDEHGAKVAEKAAANGEEPKAFVDRIAAEYAATWKHMEIAYDGFIQTTDPRHEAQVTEIVERMQQAKTPKGNDVIYKGSFTGLYCTPCESYKTKNDLTEDGLCPDHRMKPEELTEENYFFRLSDYQEWLVAHLDANPSFIRPENRFNEVRSFLNQPLQDLSITRTSVAWGVPFPGDPAHVLYVWIDALFNYYTALGIAGVRDTFWSKDAVKIHVMAKEITRFHAVFWPIFLESLGLPLPDAILAHGWFTVDGQKMSKTIGNVIKAEDLVSVFGVDATRYLLVSTTPMHLDGDISIDQYRLRYTSELANGLGNLVNRVVTLAKKYLGDTPWVAVDDALVAASSAARAAADAAYAAHDLFAATQAAREIVGHGNKLADERKIWVLAKEDPAAFATVASSLRAIINDAVDILAPVMPAKAAEIRAALEAREPMILFPRLAE